MIALCYACLLKPEVLPSHDSEDDIETPLLIDSCLYVPSNFKIIFLSRMM